MNKQLTVIKTIEGGGICMDVALRIEHDYQPGEKATRLYPGCDEKYSICGVEMQIAPGVWVDISNANYDDGDMIQHILDAREQERRDAELDRYFSRSAA